MFDPDQFDRIVQLSRMNPKGKATQAARLFLFSNLSQSQCADRFGISRAAVSVAVRRILYLRLLAQAID
jgi:DNA-binding transcriptional regulator LsrR (DeoR family)